MAKTVTRTPEEIAARVEAVGPLWDTFGKRREVLITALTAEQAAPLLNGTIEEIVALWGSDGFGPERVWERARDYLAFAVDKALNHRGLSAVRSEHAFREYVWLLTDDETYHGYEQVDYPTYGVPCLAHAALVLDLADDWATLVALHPELARMASGLPCRPGCEEGCQHP